MRRLTTTFMAAASAGLSALAVTVAVPALGDDATPDKAAAKGEVSVTQLRDCLQSHGATGVPGDERDGRTLKEWIAAHQSDESARAALKACDVYFEGAKAGGTPADKGACGPASGPKPGAVEGDATEKVRVHAARASDAT